MIRGSEQAINALHDRLVANLPAAITAINGAVTDGTLIAQPEQILDYLPSIGELVAFPTIAIEEGPGRFEDDTGYSATGAYRLVVVAFVQEAEPQLLARVSRRYQLAILRTVMADRNLGFGTGVPWGVRLLGTEPGPNLTRRQRSDEPPDTYMTWTAVAVEVKLDED